MILVRSEMCCIKFIKKINNFTKKIEWIQEQIPKSRKKRDFIQIETENNKQENLDDFKFNDPMWSKLWYIVSSFSSYSFKIHIYL